MKLENQDLAEFVDGIASIEGVLKRYDDACAALEEAEAALSKSAAGSKSFLIEAKRIASGLHAIWHDEKLFGPTETSRKKLVRSLSDRAAELVQRLTPKMWHGNVRTQDHQVTYRLGGS